MSEAILKMPDGEIKYEIKDDAVSIASYSGNDEEVVIPETVEGLFVKSIGKKAFMNVRELRTIILPDTIEDLADWCFAYCKSLVRLELPKKDIRIGHLPFFGDERLQSIYLRNVKGSGDTVYASMPEKDRSDIGVLLAALHSMKNTDHLINLAAAGTPEWFKGLDRRLLEYIDEPDEEGHAELILCGEEFLNCTQDEFASMKRKKKAATAFMRLLHPAGLSDASGERYISYIREHAFGCEHNEAWRFLRDDVGHLKEYYEYYVNSGCLNEDNFVDTLLDLGDKQTEMKAYFLRWKENHKPKENDFFDSLSL